MVADEEDVPRNPGQVRLALEQLTHQKRVGMEIQHGPSPGGLGFRSGILRGLEMPGKWEWRLAHPHFWAAPHIFGLRRGAIHCAQFLAGRDKSRPYPWFPEKWGWARAWR